MGYAFIFMMTITGFYLLSVIITYNRYIKKYDYSFWKLLIGKKNTKLQSLMTEKVQEYLEGNDLYNTVLINCLINEVTDYIKIKKSDLAFVSISGAFITFILSVLINMIEPKITIPWEVFKLSAVLLAIAIILVYFLRLMYLDRKYNKANRYKDLVKILQELHKRLLKENNKTKKQPN